MKSELALVKKVCACEVCEYGAGADPGFLDRGFKLDEGGSICAVWPIFPEIPHENEII